MKDQYADADMLAGVVEQAIVLQGVAAKSLSALEETRAGLERLKRALPEDVQRAVRLDLEGAAKAAGRAVTDQLRETMSFAQAATLAFERSRKRLTWKVSAAVAALFLLMFASLVLAPRLIGPDPDELSRLRAERDHLIESMQQLRDKGADALLGRCVDARKKVHTCVKVDESQGAFQDGYRVLAGH